jgi:hypothetical protein
MAVESEDTLTRPQPPAGPARVSGLLHEPAETHHRVFRVSDGADETPTPGSWSTLTTPAPIRGDSMAEPISTNDEWRFDDLRALYINCTLKRSPERSHTQELIDRSRSIMEGHGVTVDELRAVDHDIATGVWPDMTEHG